MYKNNPNHFRLRVKEGGMISPCTISFKMDCDALNWISSSKTGEVWQVSNESKYWFHLPEDLHLGDEIEIGWRWRGRECLSTLVVLDFKKNRLFLELKRREEIVEPFKQPPEAKKSAILKAILEVMEVSSHADVIRFMSSLRAQYENRGHLTELQLKSLIETRARFGLDPISVGHSENTKKSHLQKECEALDRAFIDRVRGTELKKNHKPNRKLTKNQRRQIRAIQNQKLEKFLSKKAPPVKAREKTKVQSLQDSFISRRPRPQGDSESAVTLH